MLVLKQVNKQDIKDPGSAITHFIAMLMAAFSALPLLIHAIHSPKIINIGPLVVFIVSMILLYLAKFILKTRN